MLRLSSGFESPPMCMQNESETLSDELFNMTSIVERGIYEAIKDVDFAPSMGRISFPPVVGKNSLNSGYALVGEGGGDHTSLRRRSDGSLVIHAALDWSAPPGTSVYSAGFGVVVEHRGKACGGLAIDHGGGVKTIYCHLSSSSLLKVGDWVNPGDQVGVVSSESGNVPRHATPHVHFAIEVNGKRVNPEHVYSRIKFDRVQNRYDIY